MEEDEIRRTEADEPRPPTSNLRPPTSDDDGVRMMPPKASPAAGNGVGAMRKSRRNLRVRALRNICVCISGPHLRVRVEG